MAKNVLGTELEVCGTDPMTGFFRNGKCDTCGDDVGQHTVCAIMTDAFLAYSRSQGNDLTQPAPAFGFPGLEAGDRWCVCLGRWVEAYEANCAPRIVLEATHASVLEYLDRDLLDAYAVEESG